MNNYNICPPPNEHDFNRPMCEEDLPRTFGANGPLYHPLPFDEYGYTDIPNPVPSHYFDHYCPPPPHHHYHRRHAHHIPMEEMFVTKRELSKILKNIAMRDLIDFDEPQETKCSVGGIDKGTKISKLNFVNFIKLALLSKEVEPVDVATQEELDNAVKDLQDSIDAIPPLTAGAIIDTLGYIPAKHTTADVICYDIEEDDEDPDIPTTDDIETF